MLADFLRALRPFPITRRELFTAFVVIYAIAVIAAVLSKLAIKLPLWLA